MKKIIIMALVALATVTANANNVSNDIMLNKTYTVSDNGITKSEIFTRLTNVIEDVLGIESMHVFIQDSLQGDLGADYLDVVELLLKTEREFDINLNPYNTANNVETVDDVVNIVYAKLNK